MTDLEITKRCAIAMFGTMDIDKPRGRNTTAYVRVDGRIFNPLHDDAQAMALVKAMPLIVVPRLDGWEVLGDAPHQAKHENLNRAICECVAKLKP